MSASQMSVSQEPRAAVEDWPPRVPAADLKGLNALHRRRGPIAFRFRGRPAGLMLAPEAEALASDAPTFRVTLGGAPALLRLPAELLAEVVRPLGLSAPLDAVEPEAAALLVEFALADDFERVMEAAGCAVETRIDRTVAPGLLHQVSLALDLDGRRFPITLWFDRDGLARLGGLLDRAAGPPGAIPADLPTPVRVCMGQRAISVAELRDIGRGDVVLMEPGREMTGPIAVVADRLATRLAVSTGRMVAAARLTALRGSAWEWCMEGDNPDSSAKAGLRDADLDQLPVKLIFELGRVDMPLGDVRRLDAGSVVPLARALDEAVDIVANGRRIGRGSIVRIGDAVGVRVERLAADE